MKRFLRWLWRFFSGRSSWGLFYEPTEIPESVKRTIRGEGLQMDAENLAGDWQRARASMARDYGMTSEELDRKLGIPKEQ